MITYGQAVFHHNVWSIKIYLLRHVNLERCDWLFNIFQPIRVLGNVHREFYAENSLLGAGPDLPSIKRSLESFIRYLSKLRDVLFWNLLHLCDVKLIKILIFTRNIRFSDCLFFNVVKF